MVDNRRLMALEALRRLQEARGLEPWYFYIDYRDGTGRVVTIHAKDEYTATLSARRLGTKERPGSIIHKLKETHEPQGDEYE